MADGMNMKTGMGASMPADDQDADDNKFYMPSNIIPGPKNADGGVMIAGGMDFEVISAFDNGAVREMEDDSGYTRKLFNQF